MTFLLFLAYFVSIAILGHLAGSEEIVFFRQDEQDGKDAVTSFFN